MFLLRFTCCFAAFVKTARKPHDGTAFKPFGDDHAGSSKRGEKRPIQGDRACFLRFCTCVSRLFAKTSVGKCDREIVYFFVKGVEPFFQNSTCLIWLFFSTGGRKRGVFYRLAASVSKNIPVTAEFSTIPTGFSTGLRNPFSVLSGGLIQVLPNSQNCAVCTAKIKKSN